MRRAAGHEGGENDCQLHGEVVCMSRRRVVKVNYGESCGVVVVVDQFSMVGSRC